MLFAVGREDLVPGRNLRRLGRRRKYAGGTWLVHRLEWYYSLPAEE